MESDWEDTRAGSTVSLGFIGLLLSINISGGLIFGYTTGIIAPALDQLFPKEQGYKEISKGAFTSSILIGAAIGSFIGSHVLRFIGIRNSFFALALLSVIGSVLSAVTNGLPVIAVMRGVLGLGVGLASVACPLYVAQNAPTDKKGFLGTFFQLAITVGIVIAYAVGLAFKNNDGWKWMFGLGAIPGTILFFLSFFTTNRHQTPDADSLLPHTSDGSIQSEEEKTQTWKAFLLGTALCVSLQLTGINAFIYYAAEIFKDAGFENNPNLPTLGVGAWNFATTLFATFFIERLGRRLLVLVGLFTVTVSCIGLALVFQFLDGETKGYVSLALLFLFIAGFEGGLGPLFWVLATEIYPKRVANYGISFMNVLQWLFNILLTLVFPIAKEEFGGPAVFGTFGGIGIVCFIIIVIFLKDTTPDESENLKK